MDDETKLTLHGLQQYYIKLEEKDKNRKLNQLLDTLEFNQVCDPFLTPSTGVHLCPDLVASKGAQQIASRVQVPVHLYPRTSESRGENCALQEFQGL